MVDHSRRKARELVLCHGRHSTSYQILNPKMQLWFSSTQNAVAGYMKYRGVRVVVGSPICEPDNLSVTLHELETDTRLARERLIFFGAGLQLMQVYATRGDYSIVSIGSQPTWDPCTWPMIVEKNASLRAQLHRAKNKGVYVEELSAEQAPHEKSLRNMLFEWLSTHGLPPLSFTADPVLFDQLHDRRVFVAKRERDDEIMAFLVATPVPARHGWFIEQWPRSRLAPNGTTHLLVDAAMRAFAVSGAKYATLGLAPLTHYDRNPAKGARLSEPWWLRLMFHKARAHGQRFYNFEGLEMFKASLRPMTWEPMFAIAQGKRFAPRMLRAIAGVFAGTLPELFVTRGIISSAAQEWQQLRSRTDQGH